MQITYRLMTDESWSLWSSGLADLRRSKPLAFGSDGPKTVEPEDLWCKGSLVYKSPGPLVSIPRGVQAVKEEAVLSQIL